MGRLIDEGKIRYTWFGKKDGTRSDGVTLQSVVEETPTAYDVEEVVKELDDLKFSYFFTLANTGEAVNDFAYKNVGNAIDKAIEIVRKGGVK